LCRDLRVVAEFSIAHDAAGSLRSDPQNQRAETELQGSVLKTIGGVPVGSEKPRPFDSGRATR
jgi:hypothetical protein